MRVLISEANVLAGRDVVFVADQLESEVVGERMAYDVNALPAFAGGSGVGYSLQPWIGRRRAPLGSSCPNLVSVGEEQRLLDREDALTGVEGDLGHGGGVVELVALQQDHP